VVNLSIFHPLKPIAGIALSTAKQKFGRDVVISAVATGARSLRHLLILPVLTHGLDQVQLGLWEQVMVGVSLAIPWVSLQLPGALVRFLPGVEDLRSRRNITYSILLFALASTLVLSLLSALGISAALADTRWSALLPLLPLIAVLTLATTGLELVRAYFRGLRQMVHHATISIAQYFSELVLVAYILLESGDIAFGLWALLIVRFALFAVGGTTIVNQLGWALPSFSGMREFLAFSVPLIPNSALYRLFDAGDRFLIALYLGHAAVGVYFVSYTAASVFATLSSPLHLVLLPTISELWNRGQKDKIAEYIRDTIRFTAILSFPAMALVVLLSGEILALLTPENYGQSARYLPVLALGFLAFSLGVPADHLLVAAGRTRILFAVNSAMVTGNIALNLLLIPHIGLWGAAFSTLAGHLLYALTAMILAQRILPFGLPWRSLALTAFNAVLMGGLVFVMKSHLPVLLTIACGGLAYLLLCIATGLLGLREWRYLQQLVGRS
jgi:O-antigen/teichoic acid export membrane protein